MSKIHEPNSQFLDRLEWQLCSEYRRKSSLSSNPRKITVSRRIAATVIVVGALMTGVSVVKATEYFKDSWQKRIEIARIETEVKLKKTHLEFTLELATQAEKQFLNGLIDEEEYRVLEHAVYRDELDLKKSLLNLDEVIASGDIPRDELYAPVVGGRDFVSERLLVTQRETEVILAHITKRAERLRQRVELGIVHETELDPIESEIAAQEVNLDKIRKRLDLRKRYIEGAISVQEVEIEGRITFAEQNLHLARSKVDALLSQLERLKELESVGMISSKEVARVEFVLTAAQAELKLAVLEMDVLREER